MIEPISVEVATQTERKEAVLEQRQLTFGDQEWRLSSPQEAIIHLCMEQAGRNVLWSDIREQTHYQAREIGHSIAMHLVVKNDGLDSPEATSLVTAVFDGELLQKRDRQYSVKNLMALRFNVILDKNSTVRQVVNNDNTSTEQPKPIKRTPEMPTRQRKITEVKKHGDTLNTVEAVFEGRNVSLSLSQLLQNARELMSDDRVLSDQAIIRNLSVLIREYNRDESRVKKVEMHTLTDSAGGDGKVMFVMKRKKPLPQNSAY